MIENPFGQVNPNGVWVRIEVRIIGIFLLHYLKNCYSNYLLQ